MRSIPNYPIWLSTCMLLAPLLMISGAWVRTLSLIWIFQIAGALMVILSLFYLSKRLHEQIEKLASQRELVDGREKAGRSDQNA